MIPGGLDVEASHLALIQSILARHVPDREVWAFGSRTTGKARTYSDLDLCILGDRPLDPSVAAALAEDFSESDLPYKVDLVDWARTSPAFRALIEREKVVLIQK